MTFYIVLLLVTSHITLKHFVEHYGGRTCFPGSIYDHHTVSVCPNGWIRYYHSCYHVSLDKDVRTQGGAKVKCAETQGAGLVRITTKEQHDFLRDTLSRYKSANPVHYYWVDGEEIGGEWRWLDIAKPVTYLPWAPGQPEHLFDAQHCIAMSNVFAFDYDDVPCFGHAGYICELSDPVLNSTVTCPPTTSPAVTPNRSWVVIGPTSH